MTERLSTTELTRTWLTFLGVDKRWQSETRQGPLFNTRLSLCKFVATLREGSVLAVDSRLSSLKTGTDTAAAVKGGRAPTGEGKAQESTREGGVPQALLAWNVWRISAKLSKIPT